MANIVGNLKESIAILKLREITNQAYDIKKNYMLVDKKNSDIASVGQGDECLFNSRNFSI